MPDRESGPYNPPIRGRLAARHTLLAEGYMGVTMIALGYSGQTGGDGSGVLHQILERMGIDDIWGYCFILIGAGMLWFSLSEFFVGRGWDDKTIAWYATWRKGCAASAGFLWIIVGYFLSTTSLSAFKCLVLTMPVHLVFLTSYFSPYFREMNA